MKIKLFFAVLLLVIEITQVNSQSRLFINLNISSEKITPLSEIRKLTFASGNLNVNLRKGNVDSYLISTINKMYFGSPSAIEDVVDNENILSVYPNPATEYLLLKNAPSSVLAIRIYQLDGSMIKNEMLINTNNQIDISYLAKGFYILKVNTQTLKFIKK